MAASRVVGGVLRVVCGGGGEARAAEEGESRRHGRQVGGVRGSGTRQTGRAAEALRYAKSVCCLPGFRDVKVEFER